MAKHTHRFYLTEMWLELPTQGDGVAVCCTDDCVNQVHGVLTSCRKVFMFKKTWQDSFQNCSVDIPHNNEKPIWMGCLCIVDLAVGQL